MSLVAFISSTVDDLAAVREEIAERLRARRVTVRMSEDPEFPVESGLTSHDACLAAVRGCDVFILLIGHRFGGDYGRSNKSITWREWEEACEHGAVVIALVEKRMDELAKVIFKRRAALAKEHPADVAALDARLRQEFPDCRPFVHNVPGVQRFIDAVRKGHIDNWKHEWRGTADDALKIIDARMTTQLAAWHRDRARVNDLATRGGTMARALAHLSGLAALDAIDVRQGRLSGDEAAQRILSLCADSREGLFGYHPADRHNFMLYRRGDGGGGGADGELRPGPRAAHPAIEKRNRSWRVGEGHVGLAVARGEVLVSGDLRQTDSWRTELDAEESDVANYVSSISVPLYLEGGRAPDGVFIVTSSRVDHFREPDQIETLTAETVGRILSMVW